MADTKDLVIKQGKTFSRVCRWEVPPIVYKAITAMTQTAPLRITAVGHDLVDAWRVAVSNVKGMTEINCDPSDVRESDFYTATVLDVDTIELNKVNAAGFKAYVSGGYIQYNTPVNLSGYTGRMTVKDRVGGTEILSLTSANGGIVIDEAKNSITIKIDADATALLTFGSGVYELEMVSSNVPAVVKSILSGKITLVKEVTT